MDPDMGKKLGDYHLTNKLKKHIKKQFQIHDRFLRDHEFRIPMIEHRDEKVCRRWDALVDEDHYHWTEQEQEQIVASIQISKVLIPCHWEIVLIPSKRCLRWNDCNKKQEKNHTCLLIITSINNGSWHRVHLQHGGTGKVDDGLFIIPKVKKEASQVLNERRNTLFTVLWRKPSEMAFTNSIYFVAGGSFTVVDGLLRCESVQQFGYRWDWRSQNTIWLQLHKYTTKSRRKELHNWYCVCVVKPSDTNDNVTTKTQSTFHTAHMNLNTWMMHARCDVRQSSSQVLVVMICTPHRGLSLSCSRLSCHPCMQWPFFFDFELSIPPNFLFSSFIFILLQSLLHFFHNLEGSSNIAYFIKKGMDSADESYFLTQHKCRGIAPRHQTRKLSCWCGGHQRWWGCWCSARIRRFFMLPLRNVQLHNWVRHLVWRENEAKMRWLVTARWSFDDCTLQASWRQRAQLNCWMRCKSGPRGQEQLFLVSEDLLLNLISWRRLKSVQIKSVQRTCTTRVGLFWAEPRVGKQGRSNMCWNAAMSDG